MSSARRRAWHCRRCRAMPLPFAFAIGTRSMVVRVVTSGSSGSREFDSAKWLTTASCPESLSPAGNLEEVRHRKNGPMRSEEHTSELQSRGHLVCRLLLEKKKQGSESHYI